jgi:hypothetical protein
LGVVAFLFTACFTPNFLIANAVSPPVEVALPAIIAAVAKHTGHMDFSFLSWPIVRRMLFRDLGLVCEPGWVQFSIGGLAGELERM